MLKRFLYNILPSGKSDYDPATCVSSDGSDCLYEPGPLFLLNLIKPIRKRFNRYRQKPIVINKPDRSKKLAIIIPYRDRAEHLKTMLPVLTKHLYDQEIRFEIFVIEQNGFDQWFNRGMMKNIGFDVAKDDFDYFCFHDVDIMPEIAEYGAINQPVMLATHCIHPTRGDQHNPRDFTMGSVIQFSREHFVLVNGFSNHYWTWGNEDMDLFVRCLHSGLVPVRQKKGRFHMLDHPLSTTQTADGEYHADEKIIENIKQERIKCGKKLRLLKRGNYNFHQDGLNKLRYKILSREYTKDNFHHVKVEI